MCVCVSTFVCGHVASYHRAGKLTSFALPPTPPSLL